MQTNKYVGQKGMDDGTSLFWSPDLDVPFRGHQPPLLKGDEFDRRLTTEFDFKNFEFDLRDPPQATEYRAVMDRIVNGWYQLHVREFSRDETGRTRFVYVEWSERYTVLVPARSPSDVAISSAD